MTKSASALRVFTGGVLASLAMLLVLGCMPLFGAPKLNIFVLLSTLSPEYNWWVEPLEYFVLATVVFPMLFNYMLYDNLPGRRPWQKGLAWGLTLWLLRGLIVGPIMGEGLFSRHAPYAVAGFWETLLAHAIYGIILGAVIGRPKGTMKAPRRAPTPSPPTPSNR